MAARTWGLVALNERLVKAVETGSVDEVAMDARPATDVMAYFLLQHGADVNVRDKFGNTPLHAAAEMDDVAKAALLIKFAAARGPITSTSTSTTTTTTTTTTTANSTTANGSTSHNGEGEDSGRGVSGTGGSTVQTTPPLEINAVNDTKTTPLHTAAGNGNCQLVELLLKAGADANTCDTHGTTPLHRAAEEKFPDCAQALIIVGGADVNAQTHLGNTPLHRAAWRGHAAVCRILLDLGADKSTENNSGKTPTMLAAQAKFPDVAELLG